MNTGLLYWPLFVLAHAFVGLIVGGGVYFAVRAVEKCNRHCAHYINVLIGLLLLLGIAAYAPNLLPFALLIPFLAGLVGFRFHQLSGGASASSNEAIFLMAFASLVTINIGSPLLMLLPFRVLNAASFVPLHYTLLISFYFVILFIAGFLPPFLLWLYQNSRLRPGIDRHLNEGEEAEPTP